MLHKDKYKCTPHIIAARKHAAACRQPVGALFQYVSWGCSSASVADLFGAGIAAVHDLSVLQSNRLQSAAVAAAALCHSAASATRSKACAL